MAWVVGIAAAGVLLWVAAIGGLVVAGRGSAAREVASFVPDCLVLLRRLLADGRVARPAKVAVGTLVAYLLLPFDLVPDFIPVAGHLDDAILVAAAIAFVVRRSGRAVVEELWPGSPSALRVVLALST